jgi:hypothetical protein
MEASHFVAEGGIAEEQQEHAEAHQNHHTVQHFALLHGPWSVAAGSAPQALSFVSIDSRGEDELTRLNVRDRHGAALINLA